MWRPWIVGARWSSRDQGFQTYGFRLSTNRVESLRLIYGLIIVVCLCLRIGAPWQYSLNSILGIPQGNGEGANGKTWKIQQTHDGVTLHMTPVQDRLNWRDALHGHLIDYCCPGYTDALIRGASCLPWHHVRPALSVDIAIVPRGIWVEDQEWSDRRAHVWVKEIAFLGAFLGVSW